LAEDRLVNTNVEVGSVMMASLLAAVLYE